MVDECEESYRNLKVALTMAQVLVLPTGKANVAADDLSRNVAADDLSMGSLAFIPAEALAMDVKDLANRFVRLDIFDPIRVFSCVVAQLSLFERIKARRYDDPHLLLQYRICVKDVDGLRELILQEDHISRYFIHPSIAKMYRDLKQHYWWKKMKKDIVGNASRC
ncbi:uncharacterized protein [Nicotiana tomentosiformis]|uniref:uncharacterized protein n=1 Tax=Nicotiana tomentosiformis TaxID=4098 RepID=UPI00388C5767